MRIEPPHGSPDARPEIVSRHEPAVRANQAMRRDVDRRQMMLGRQLADRLRLAVNEFRAELDRDLEVRRMLGENPSAEP